MSKDKISDYDPVAAQNTDVGGINLSEGVMVPSDLNNAQREIMSHLADFADGTTGVDVLNLQDDDASASIKIQAPATLTTTTTFTLPDGDGSNGQVLDTDGSGTLAWTKVQAENLDVAGDGTAGQVLASDGDGSFSWANQTSYPQVITIKTSGDYDIPADAQAVMIRASGGGGGGTDLFPSGGGLGVADGTDGGSTTVTNGTLSIAVTATGGRAGHYTTGSIASKDVISGSTGGDVMVGAGAAGGRSTAAQGGNFTYDGPASPATNGNVVHKYVTGSNVGGETLTISYGAAGAAGNSEATAGQAGYVEIWVW